LQPRDHQVTEAGKLVDVLLATADWTVTNTIGVILGGLSLIAVVIIGLASIKIGQRSAAAAEDSSKASVKASEATERAAEATERSVAASERTAALAEIDARARRLTAVLDVVIEMRQLWNAQEFDPDALPRDLRPQGLARLALSRKLEGAIVPFEQEFGQTTETYGLTMRQDWSNSQLEGAIAEVKTLLRSTITGTD
jgi:hypothetical protein